MRIEHNHQQPIQLVQITDSHLGDQSGDALLGMDTDTSLNHVIDLIKPRCPQVLLATGDISHAATVASYQRFHQLTHGLAEHSLWLPGNHDDVVNMQQAMAGETVLNRFMQIGNWHLLMLNSAVAGKVGGSLVATELEFLRDCLQRSTGSHVLVCLHHHPITIGCEWLDDQQVDNAEQFFEILDEFDHVRAVLWGHIHQEVDELRNGVRLLASPSSCIQFAPQSKDFKLDRLNPGFRWLELHADGSLDTGVERITGVELEINYSHSSGY
ncbi:3',5'-cyclic-AMP phosphodiesterase [Oceanicoccus sp. KOV_DT_Chl]|uniref:3',5'-cyclic-AMP phosphodiesterase n=1 Tax=Oceanicoccus sp. KOV_DT_Chl TaxID=1904639 RepID=UPI000C7E11C7|nr:3',5'-cyclic-AMP phosphodiesterase [Oceanicoccus sp. KOV_DT_Chl]